MDKELLLEVERKLEGLLASFHQQLQKTRTGRANPVLIESVPVVCYGGTRPLKGVAQVATEGASLLLVTAYDPSINPAIEKALLNAGLGIGVKRGAQMLTVTFPPLTQERRVELAKQLKLESEQMAVSMRNVRRDANEALKSAKKAKEITEDQQKQAEKSIQKHLDAAITVLSAETKRKIEDIMQI